VVGDEGDAAAGELLVVIAARTSMPQRTAVVDVGEMRWTVVQAQEMVVRRSIGRKGRRDIFLFLLYVIGVVRASARRARSFAALRMTTAGAVVFNRSLPTCERRPTL